MSDDEILEGLEKLMADVGIELRYEKGEFIGGWYRYLEKEQLLVNKRIPTDRKVEIIAKVLSNRVDLQQVYVVPAIREVLENASRVE